MPASPDQVRTAFDVSSVPLSLTMVVAPVFSDTGLLLDAAVAGAGVALARERLVAGELAAGRLVRLFDTAIPDIQACHPVWPAAEVVGSRELVGRFAAWLRNELA